MLIFIASSPAGRLPRRPGGPRWWSVHLSDLVAARLSLSVKMVAVDPDLRALLWLAALMVTAGGTLSLALHSLWWLVGAFFALAVVGLLSLTRSRD